MTFALFVNSTQSISFDPEWDFATPGKKMETQHRTKGGKLYRYRWSAYERFKFELSFVTSADASVINSWWENNAALLFLDEDLGFVAVTSVVITNKSQPMSTRIMPYTEFYKGVIELVIY